MKTASSTKARSGGRPSQEEAGLIEGRILDAASDLFFTHGYGITSIESIAAKAGISKRTFYARFQDKADVFKAVIHRIVLGLRPPDISALFIGKNCEEILRRLASLIIHASLKPQTIALHRILQAEAQRFPELAAMANAEGTRQEALSHIAKLLEAEDEAGRLHVTNALFAATQFLQLIVAEPQRRAMGLGAPMQPDEIEQWVSNSVELFFNGLRLTK